MRIRHICLVMLAMLSMNGRAQDWYWGVSGGLTQSLSENMTAKELLGHTIPTGMLMLGDNITPCVGLRATAAFRPQVGRPGAPQREVLPDTYKRYRFNTLTADLDVTLNLTNIFNDIDYARQWELVVMAGGGLMQSRDFSKHVKDWEEYYPVNREHKIYVTYNAGLQVLKRLNRFWKLDIEARGFMTDDKYNGVSSGGGKDFFFDCQVGLVYFFDGRKRTYTEPVNIRHDYLPRYDRGTVFDRGAGTLQEVKFYLESATLTSPQLALVEEIAEYLKTSSLRQVTICGYPDNEELAADINLKIASARADLVRQLLVDQYGIATGRIKIEYSGTPYKGFRATDEYVTGVTVELK